MSGVNPPNQLLTKKYKKNMAHAEDAASAVEEPVVADEPIEEKDTPEIEEEVVIEEDEPSEEPELTKREKTLEAQKEHWRKKYQDLEKQPKVAPAKEKGGEIETSPRVEFLLMNRELSSEEYKHISIVAMRDDGKITVGSLETAMESEKSYLTYIRRKAENKVKQPGSTSSSSSTGFEKSAKEIGEMTPEQHRAYEEQVLKAESQGI